MIKNIKDISTLECQVSWLQSSEGSLTLVFLQFWLYSEQKLWGQNKGYKHQMNTQYIHKGNRKRKLWLSRLNKRTSISWSVPEASLSLRLWSNDRSPIEGHRAMFAVWRKDWRFSILQHLMHKYGQRNCGCYQTPCFSPKVSAWVWHTSISVFVSVHSWAQTS